MVFADHPFHYMIQGTHKGSLGSLEPTNELVQREACYVGRSELRVVWFTKKDYPSKSALVPSGRRACTVHQPQLNLRAGRPIR